MTDKGMLALLLSALLLESLSPEAAADEARHGRRSRKPSRADLPTVSADAAASAGKSGSKTDSGIQIPKSPAPRVEPPPAPLVSTQLPAGAPMVISAPNASPAAPAPTPMMAPMMAPQPMAPGATTFAPGPGIAVSGAAGVQHLPAAQSGKRGSMYKTMTIAGAGLIGASYALSLALGGISYGAFVDGQYGWFVPGVGPILVMSGVCGNPGSCYFKTVFTYILGPFATIGYLGGLTLAIVGAVGQRRSLLANNRFQLMPYASTESSGLVLLGRF